MAANSPMREGKFTGWASSRQQIWGDLDTARCGPVLGASGDDPTTDWAHYALKAPVMLVNDPDPLAVREWVPFVDWVEGRVLLGNRRPTAADLDYHLTTLFPPVRPRRWLEIRYLDVVGETLWPAVVFTLTTLLDELPDEAASITEAVATAWDTAARVGLRDRRLYESANRCLDLVAGRTPAGLAEPMARLVGMVRQGRCAADEFAEDAVRVGVAPAIRQRMEGAQ